MPVALHGGYGQMNPCCHLGCGYVDILQYKRRVRLFAGGASETLWVDPLVCGVGELRLRLGQHTEHGLDCDLIAYYLDLDSEGGTNHELVAYRRDRLTGETVGELWRVGGMGAFNVPSTEDWQEDEPPFTPRPINTFKSIGSNFVIAGGSNLGWSFAFNTSVLQVRSVETGDVIHSGSILDTLGLTEDEAFFDFRTSFVRYALPNSGGNRVAIIAHEKFGNQLYPMLLEWDATFWKVIAIGGVIGFGLGDTMTSFARLFGMTYFGVEATIGEPDLYAHSTFIADPYPVLAAEAGGFVSVQCEKIYSLDLNPSANSELLRYNPDDEVASEYLLAGCDWSYNPNAPFTDDGLGDVEFAYVLKDALDQGTTPEECLEDCPDEQAFDGDPDCDDCESEDLDITIEFSEPDCCGAIWMTVTCEGCGAKNDPDPPSKFDYNHTNLGWADGCIDLGPPAISEGECGVPIMMPEDAVAVWVRFAPCDGASVIKCVPVPARDPCTIELLVANTVCGLEHGGALSINCWDHYPPNDDTCLAWDAEYCEGGPPQGIYTLSFTLGCADAVAHIEWDWYTEGDASATWCEEAQESHFQCYDGDGGPFSPRTVTIMRCGHWLADFDCDGVDYWEVGWNVTVTMYHGDQACCTKHFHIMLASGGGS